MYRLLRDRECGRGLIVGQVPELLTNRLQYNTTILGHGHRISTLLHTGSYIITGSDDHLVKVDIVFSYLQKRSGQQKANS